MKARRPAAGALTLLLAASSLLAQVSPGELERQAAAAGRDFDGTAAPPGVPPADGAAAQSAALAKAAKSSMAASAAKKKEPEKPSDDHKVWRPTGLGPVSTERRPGYGRGLLGGLLGLIVAPLLFAWEAVETVVSMPYRMIKGLAEGDGWSLLEPIRTAKNLLQDAIVVAGGMISSATAPIWNAAQPDKVTDFEFKDHRLIFSGGPMELVLDAVNEAGDLHWAAATPSMHTVVMRREVVADPHGSKGESLYTHEYVHGYQWRESFLWEKQSHDFLDKKDFHEAGKDLNW